MPFLVLSTQLQLKISITADPSNIILSQINKTFVFFTVENYSHLKYCKSKQQLLSFFRINFELPCISLCLEWQDIIEIRGSTLQRAFLFCATWCEKTISQMTLSCLPIRQQCKQQRMIIESVYIRIYMFYFESQ